MLAAAAALCLAGYAAIMALRYRGCTTAKISLTARLVLNERGSGRHVFVFGMTGSGKTTTVKRILASLKPPCPVLVKPLDQLEAMQNFTRASPWKNPASHPKENFSSTA